MDRDEAIKILTGGPDGIKEWNRRREAGEEIPNLAGADLQEANLFGAYLQRAILFGANLRNAILHRANLSSANLQEANLSGANLHEADLVGANLQEANLSEANLQKANLSSANLQEANLVNANLQEANLVIANLQEANLERANLQEANLDRTNLQEANLFMANLQEAKLFATNLQGAKLYFADLTGADLSHIGSGHLWHVVWPFYRKPFLLDRTRVRETRFEHNVADPWSVLRRSYTGPSMVFVLLFSVVAFLPLILQTFFWIGVSRVEEQVVAASVVAIQKTADVLRPLHLPAWSGWLQRTEDLLKRFEPRLETYSQRATPVLPDAKEVQALFALLEEAHQILATDGERLAVLDETARELQRAETFVEQARQLVELVHPKANVAIQEKRVWHLLLRGRNEGVFIAVLSSLLLLYNAARFALTYIVGQMRDAEERSSVTPSWSQYRPLWHIHQAIAPLLAISVSYGIYRLVVALLTPVIVFG